MFSVMCTYFWRHCTRPYFICRLYDARVGLVSFCIAAPASLFDGRELKYRRTWRLLQCSSHKVSLKKKISELVLKFKINPLNPELNPICYLLALLGVHHFPHVSRIRVKSLTLRLLMSYIYIWSAYSWCF